jgi:exodeoxyribonuclease VII large subunit
VNRLTVTALAQQIDRLLNRSFPRMEVEGELAQLQVPASGHAYLTLRDGDASLSCVIWRNEWRQHDKPPRVGQRVVCTGRLGGYAPQGKYQLYATRAVLAGQGELQERLEKIRARLRADGLLDPRRRRPLPRYPRTIGVVTSLGGAALQDFLRVSRHRWPAARILVSGCTVQGDQAASSVVRALELLYEDGRADVIVLTRGGGSQLDLLPFHDEQLARWVATSPVPIVSAVGHEIDTPLTDEVADASAATPSAAAMLVLPDGPALQQRVDEGAQALERAMRRMIGRRRARLGELTARLRHPARTLADHQRRRIDLERRLHEAAVRRIRSAADRLDALERRLHALSPVAVLGRGYAIVRGPRGVVRDPGEVAPGDALAVRVAGGTFPAVRG